MKSVDTNILFYALNPSSRFYDASSDYLRSVEEDSRMMICELVLVELYILLRNPTVMSAPLSSEEAGVIVKNYRENPYWRVVENAPVMSIVWDYASHSNFARRRIFDVRLGLTLKYHGVEEFATANVNDFEGLGFKRLFSPLH